MRFHISFDYFMDGIEEVTEETIQEIMDYIIECLDHTGASVENLNVSKAE